MEWNVGAYMLIIVNVEMLMFRWWKYQSGIWSYHVSCISDK